MRRRAWMAWILGASLAGCQPAPPPPPKDLPGGSSPAHGSHSGSGAGGSTTALVSGENGWTMPPVAKEASGVPIPRTSPKNAAYDSKSPIPADVGNAAAVPPGEKATGDRLVARFPSEPKSLNPIVETSAVQTYMGQYVHEALAWQNPETLGFEPHIAERWVTEDVVKLSPDYPGHVRRVSVKGAAENAAAEIANFPFLAGTDGKSVAEFATFDGDGKPSPNTWVGLTPLEKIPGAPLNGFHSWSNSEGIAAFPGLPSGKFRVRVGAEIYGKTTVAADGSVDVVAESPDNPLAAQLKEKGEASLKLTASQVIDTQLQTVYTYYLRSDVKWSDGTPYTTKDLEFAYAVINNPYVDGESIRTYYSDLVECAALKPHVIRMKYRQQYFKAFEFTAGLGSYTPPWHVFKKFFADQGKELTLDQLTPEQETAANKVSVHGQAFGKFFNTDPRYNESPLGTGPYIFDVWARSDRVEVRRNENYWNAQRAGHLDRIVFKFISDNVTAMQALKAGEIDFFYYMGAEQYFKDLDGPPDWFKDRYVKGEWFSPRFSYIGWNALRPVFQDPRVRLALAMLVNRDEFIQKKLYGSAVPVTGPQYIFGTMYDNTVQPIGYDPEAARDLLAEAGWIDSNNDGVLDKSGVDLKFQLLYPPGNSMVDDLAATYQRALKDAGVAMSIQNIEWASFIEKIHQKDFDAVTLSWASSAESDSFQIWHGSQAGAGKRSSNHVSYNSAEADDLIERIRVTVDEDQRRKYQHALHRVIDRDQPYAFLWTPKEFGAYHQRFRGVRWYRIRPGFDFSEWYVPKELQKK